MLIDNSWIATLKVSRRGLCYYTESPDMRRCPKCKRRFGINKVWEDAPEGACCPFCGRKVSPDNAISPNTYTTKW